MYNITLSYISTKNVPTQKLFKNKNDAKLWASVVEISTYILTEKAA